MNTTDLVRFEKDGIELYINTTTGESFASISGYARMSGKAKSTLSDRLEKLVRSEMVKEAEVDTGYGIKCVKLLNISTVLEWLTKDNPNIIKVIINKIETVTGKSLELPNFPTSKKKKHKNPEKEVQIKLANKLNGITEVQCKTGIADILTETEIIEVKKVKEWKHAIGQVLVYQLEYPDRQARIHLYEECSEEFKQMVVSFASKLNITATFEN